MIPEFESLSAEEVELMFKTPFLVAILVAGADQNIDQNEINQAVAITKLKLTRARKELINYFQHVGVDFEDKLKIFIHDLPQDTDERNEIISEELSKLNDILPKLSRKFAIGFYESIKDYAKKIAEASGGIFGFLAIGYEESKVIDLKMIKDPSK